MQGDRDVSEHSANSSSWGESRLHFMLSIGRCEGRKNDKNLYSKAFAVRKDSSCTSLIAAFGERGIDAIVAENSAILNVC